MADNASSPSAPSICVIIAAYNAQTTIARAITSALAEPEVSEVIIVDDASQDDTIATARAADDGSNRLQILTLEKNAGPAAARNRALEVSKAEWITILDADDFFLPGRMSGMLAYADKAAMIADNMWQVDEHDINGPRTSLLDPAPQEAQKIDFTTFVWSNVTRANRYRGELGFIKPLIRRAALDLHHIRYAENMRLGEDFELYARLLSTSGAMLLVPAQGYVSVVRANSLSGKHSEEDLKALRDGDAVLLKDLNLTPEQKRALRAHYLSVDCRYQWRMLILAVKARNPKQAFATFARPWPVPWYLLCQLGQQVWLRSFGKQHANA